MQDLRTLSRHPLVASGALERTYGTTFEQSTDPTVTDPGQRDGAALAQGRRAALLLWLLLVDFGAFAVGGRVLSGL